MQQLILSDEKNSVIVPSGLDLFAPSLIARFQCSEAICTCDMIRFSLKFFDEKEAVSLMNRVQFDFSGLEYFQSTRIASFYHLWVIPFGSSSVSLGVGFRNGAGKVDFRRGFLEFNPNKVAKTSGFLDFLRMLSVVIVACECTRFDLALDFLCSRSNFHLLKDRRKYRLEVSCGVTEYLGVRNSPGYVKLYDKTAERAAEGVSLSVPVTRLEVTCSGKLINDKKQWPSVVALSDSDLIGVSSLIKCLALVLHDYPQGGLPFSFYDLPYRTRKKLEKLAFSDPYPFPSHGYSVVQSQIENWRNVLLGRPIVGDWVF